MMMMRANFENSGYKRMKVKDFEHQTVTFTPTAPRTTRRPESRPGFGAMALGAVCAVAVLGVLGLLYSIG
jgi:hypothetical protein